MAVVNAIQNCNILGGKFQWGAGGYSNGPIGHQGTSWKTENAWDLMTTPDTEVYSITDGVVTKIKSPKTDDSHLFGASIEVLGKGENPTVFYCNLSGIKVRVGSKVSVGEKLGKVATAPNHGESFLHVALPVGKSITSLVSSTGEIYTKTSKEPIVKKVEEPKTKFDYLEICKQFLDPEDYQDILCGIMDKEHYDALEKPLRNVIDSYFSFKE